MKQFTKFKLKISKVTFSVIVTIFIGMIIGVISTSTLKNLDYQIVNSSKSYVKIFLNAFSLNYWYFFVLWIFGMIPLGFCLSYFVTFFKSFMMGVTLAICLKSSALFGIVEFVGYIFLDGLILIPTLIYLATASINFSLIGKSNYQRNPNQYFGKLLKVTIIIIIYAILTSLKMTFLEVS